MNWASIWLLQVKYVEQQYKRRLKLSPHDWSSESWAISFTILCIDASNQILKWNQRISGRFEFLPSKSSSISPKCFPLCKHPLTHHSTNERIKAVECTPKGRWTIRAQVFRLINREQFALPARSQALAYTAEGRCFGNVIKDQTRTLNDDGFGNKLINWDPRRAQWISRALRACVYSEAIIIYASVRREEGRAV